jgi:NADH dehydrogenase
MNRTRIVVVGAGFAGLACVRRLQRRLAPGQATITLVTPINHQLYLPLLPQVAAGVLSPQSVAVPLRRVLNRAEIIPGGAVGVDPAARRVIVRQINDQVTVVPYDRLVLTPGSVTRTFDIPGLAEHARGMKTLAEAAHLRDHVITQLDLAAATGDREEQLARLQFVVVGGGYAGTETVTALQRLTASAVRRYPHLDPDLVRWHLVDISPKLMPELGDRLGSSALRVLEKRGIKVSLNVSVANVRDDSVALTDGRRLPTNTLVWTAGVAASPLVGTLGAETQRGRLTVTPEMRLPGHAGIFAVGDAAAVPDLTGGPGAICPPTAQHAQRQGLAVADNIAADLSGLPMRPYRHRNLGLVVDLGGWRAVSKPLGMELTGVPAQAVARGYHLMALRTGSAKTRVLTDWLLNTTAGDDFVRTGFQRNRPATLRDLEYTDAYLTRDQIHALTAQQHTTTGPGSGADTDTSHLA